MTDTFKNLGQAESVAATDIDLYIVPATTLVSLSGLQICNTNNATVHVRAAIRLGGAAISPAAYHVYDFPLEANDSMRALEGVTISSADVVTVRADSTGVAFNLSGVEVTP